MILTEHPKRKPQRLQGFDYSQNGAYFITICTQKRLPLFCDVIDNHILINHAGKMVEERLLNISNGVVAIVKYCIMPNHIHAILSIAMDGTTQGSFPTTVSEVVQRFKTITTKLYIDGVKNGDYPTFDKKIWQKSFHDHVIRNEQDYQEIWKYIDEKIQPADNIKKMMRRRTAFISEACTGCHLQAPATRLNRSLRGLLSPDVKTSCQRPHRANA